MWQPRNTMLSSIRLIKTLAPRLLGKPISSERGLGLFMKYSSEGQWTVCGWALWNPELISLTKV